MSGIIDPFHTRAPTAAYKKAASTGGFLVKACSLLFGQVQVQLGLGFGPFAFGLVRGHRFLHRTALLQQDESHPAEQDNQYPNPA